MQRAAWGVCFFVLTACGSDSGADDDAGGTVVEAPHGSDDDAGKTMMKPPRPSVGDCDGLGAVDEFQNITPPGVKEVLHVLVDPVTSGTIYAGTMMQGIYKSTDCGSTWALVSTGANSDIVASGGQWSMQIDPKFPNVIYSGNLYAKDNALYKSTNSGVDWVSLFPAGSEVAKTVDYVFTQEVAIDPDPKRNGHLLVSFHADCKGPTGPQCLAESLDGGATWRLFKGPVSGWAENARPMIIDEKTFLYVTWSDGVFFTKNSGATWERGGDGGNHQMYKAKNGTYYMGTPYGMAKSTDALHWERIDKSPQGDGLVGDGSRIFTSRRAADDKQFYFVSDEGDGLTWAPYAAPEMDNGGVTLRYDAQHKLLYSANTASGLWRVKTKAD